MKKALRLMAITLLTVQILVSCGGMDHGTTKDPTDTTTDVESTTAAETSILDSLPERDYEGTEYTILAPIEQVVTKYLVEDMGEYYVIIVYVNT